MIHTIYYSGIWGSGSLCRQWAEIVTAPKLDNEKEWPEISPENQKKLEIWKSCLSLLEYLSGWGTFNVVQSNSSQRKI